MKKDNFHVDMSGRIYEERTIGVALVATENKIHYGCALKGNLVKLIKKNLFKKNIYEDSAKLYAICIFLLVKNVRREIKTLIICNDEDFEIVKIVLNKLLRPVDFEIINITEFRKLFGKNINSLAHNYANIYRKKALKPNRWAKGKELNIISVKYNLIKQVWEELEKK
ncbi:MAG: hypothetical protein AABY06_03005 [Nanoarchaeota archaeon]